MGKERRKGNEKDKKEALYFSSLILLLYNTSNCSISSLLSSQSSPPRAPPETLLLCFPSTEHSITSYSTVQRVTNPHIELEPGNLVGRKGLQEKAKESETPPLSLLGGPWEHQAKQP